MSLITHVEFDRRLKFASGHNISNCHRTSLFLAGVSAEDAYSAPYGVMEYLESLQEAGKPEFGHLAVCRMDECGGYRPFFVHSAVVAGTKREGVVIAQRDTSLGDVSFPITVQQMREMYPQGELRFLIPRPVQE